ncbi:hypothetical protein [Kangiella sp. TOML190]|uniref:hypothetical protein n=1 Tax=Kangiella sp. TOML190 TaxID=2931351 RepID=UPI0020410A17|nr:hypothetical protein [Kangiella sp. TOML190]
MDKLTFYTLAISTGFLIICGCFIAVLKIYLRAKRLEEAPFTQANNVPNSTLKQLKSELKDIEAIKNKNMKEYTRQLQRWQLKTSAIGRKYQIDLVALILEE